MASNIRRRSSSQLSPEEEQLLQTVLSQDSAALASLRLRHGTTVAAVLQMGDGYPEAFVLHFASQLEREGKPVTSLTLYVEVERQAALRSESFMKKLNAQTLSKTSELTEMKTAAPSPTSSSELSSSASSFRSASHLQTSDITGLSSQEASGGATTATMRQSQPVSAAQPWYSPQYVLTESNRARGAAKGEPVSTDCARGVQRPTTEKGKGGMAQQENLLRNSACGEDVVDGATQGHMYEDEVDNVEVKPGLTITRPQQKPGVGLFSNMVTLPSVKPGQGEKSPDDCMKALRIRECLQAVTGENKILESYRLCTVCRKSPRNITFLPCGHFTTCRDCAGPIYVCGLCGKNVLATVDTFLS